MDRKSIAVKWFAVAVLAVCWCPQGRAQVADSQAYLQWMIAVTDDTLTPRMAAHLSVAGLQDHERDSAAAILTKFKAEEFGLEASYNNLPSTLAGSNAGTTSFYAKQEALIRRTIDSLKLAVSGPSFVSLDNRVQHESKNIRNDVVAHNHGPHLIPAAFHPQGGGMVPNYSYYTTVAGSAVTATITASMLSDTNPCNVELPQWNPTNLVDGNTSDVGFSTDTSQANQSCIRISLGTAQDIVELGLYLSASNYNGHFNIYYSDGPSWTLAASDFEPSAAGWNYIGWPDAGAHLYWSLSLVNTPGIGPTINELQLVQPGMMVYATSQVTGTTGCGPNGCPPGAQHDSRLVNTFGGGQPILGPWVSPTSYINSSDNQSELLLPGNPPVSRTTGGSVWCTDLNGPIGGSSSVNNDYEQAVSYMQNQKASCGTVYYNGVPWICVYQIDNCTPASVPPDFDPLEFATPNPVMATLPFFNTFSMCDRPHGASPGTLWGCLWPTPSGWTVPRGTPARRTCTNQDKGTRGVWPGPW